MLPLKKMKYEHTEFYAPNKPLDYLLFEVADPMKFPNDLGISHHHLLRDRFIQEYGA